MTRYLLGTFLAALAMYIWGAAFWMNPVTYSYFRISPNDAEAGVALQKYFPQSGTYVIPGDMKDPKAAEALHEKGPLAMVHIRHDGEPMMNPRKYIMGFVHLWIATLLAAFLAVRAAPAVSNAYGKRLWFFVLIGALIAIYANLSSPIWMNNPWTYHTVFAVYNFSAWLIGGLVLAATVKPQE